MLSSLGMILFILFIGAIAWVLNQVIWRIGDHFHYWDQKPRKTRWYDKYMDKMNAEIMLQQTLLPPM